jgi:hypothetical protein
MATFHAGEPGAEFAGSYSAIFVDGVALSSAALRVDPDSGFCRVTERAGDRESRISDGALVSRANTAIISLQDRLTRSPSQYLLAKQYGAYEIHGTQAVFVPGAQPDVRTVTATVSRPSGPRDEIMPPAASMEEALPASFHWPERAHFAEFLSGIVDRGASLFSALRGHLFAGRSKQTILAAATPQAEGNVQGSTEAMSHAEMQTAFLAAAESADEAGIRRLVNAGVDIDEPDDRTGLTALHLCVGRNALGPARFLIEAGAAFVPDKLGRMPSVIAAECEVSDELADVIVEAETRAEGV